MKKYMFNNPVDMIELARDIQSKMYWRGFFYCEEESSQYKYFWDLCSIKLSDEYTGVEITDNDEVTFIKSLAD